MNRARLSVAGAFLLLALATSPLVSQTYVYTINAYPTAAAGGNALVVTLANITDASASKPYLIKLEPGIYDVGYVRVQLKPYVDIEGSGQGNTIIQGPGNAANDLVNGVLKGASSMEIRNLRIACWGGAGTAAIALFNGSTSPTLRNVTVTSGGGNINWGIRNVGANPLIEDSTITVSGGTTSYGIVNTSSARPIIRRTVVSATGSTSAFGIYNDQSGLPQEVRDVKITASGTGQSYGFYNNLSSGTPGTSILYSTIAASGAAGDNYGIYFNSTDSLTISQTQVTASGSSSYGLFSQSAALNVQHSGFSGGTYSISTATAGAKIGLTQLSGPFLPSGAPICAGVYNQNMTFYPGPACP